MRNGSLGTGTLLEGGATSCAGHVEAVVWYADAVVAARTVSPGARAGWSDGAAAAAGWGLGTEGGWAACTWRS
jgi:hypothetical protein